jgi:uncharacterized protein (TIGR03086 family)
MVQLFSASVEAFDQRVQAIGDAWEAPTPCDQWNVRDLVNHVAVEDLWVPELLDGKSIEEVGDALDGDQLGNDPLAGWGRARDESLAAAQAEGALEATAHLSYGDFSGAHYLSHVGSDNVVHAWDLARAVGANEELGDELVEFVFESLGAFVEEARSFGAYGPALQAGAGADRQTQMLALFGRKA